MQLNNKTLKGIRAVRGFWVALLAIVFGALFAGLGVYFFVSGQSKHYEQATATILTNNSEVVGEDTLYHVTIKFTDKNGIEHTGIEMQTYDDSWTVGKQIQIKYNVDDPTDVTTEKSATVLPWIFIGLGSISAIVGVASVIYTTKMLKRRAKNVNNDKKESSQSSAKEKLTNKKLFFHLTGKMNQSYAVENMQGQTVYDCKLVKFSLFGASTYEFANHQTGESKQLKIGKTVSSESDGGLPIVGDMLSSHFKIDGTNCWDYVADMGYEVRHLFEGKTVISYQIEKNGKVVANIYPADAKDPFNEDSKRFFMMNKGYYRLEIVDAKLSDIVMIAFIVSRTYMVE